LVFIRNFYVRQSVFAALHAGCVLLGLSPFDIWPLAFAGVFFIFLAAHEQADKNLRQIIFSGLVFALALATIPFGWIIGTIHRYTGENIVLTFSLTIFYAVLFQTKAFFFFVARRSFFRREWSGVTAGLTLAAVLAVIDALNPELFVWAWGNTLSGEPHLRQWAAVCSVYGVSFIACFGGWILFKVLILPKMKGFSGLAKDVFPELVILLIFFIVGALLRYMPVTENGARLNALIVQTNIGAAPEAKRSDAAFAADAINRLFNQSIEGLIMHPQSEIILWPEASMPFHAAEKTEANKAIYSATFDGVLEYLSRISGAPVLYQGMRYEKGNLYSEMAARPQGEARYFKRRLVPWGEYLPFETFIPSLRKIFPDAGKFSTGDTGNEFSVRLAATAGRLPARERLAADLAILADPREIQRRYPSPERGRVLTVKPLLCYEALFPSDARTRDADVIVNLSSDAWFGDGVEGHQHAGAASLRAVENGIPMLRGAMSGVSYAVDYRGDAIGRVTGQGRAEILAAEVPLTKRKTPFSRFGMTAFYLLMFAAIWPYAVQKFRFFRIRENR
jgi:apolipoprotein N-acyltransferase